jgi:plastocyanin
MMKRVLALVVLAVLTAVTASAAVASPARVAAAPSTVTVTAAKNGTGYNKKTLTVPAGKEFLLVFNNLSSKQHNVSLEVGELEYGATQTVGKGSAASIFTLKKGVYHFYSSVGNDETAGFSGTLTAK